MTGMISGVVGGGNTLVLTLTVPAPVSTPFCTPSLTQVAALAIKAMPWTIWSAVAMSVVQLVWCLVAAIAAVGSFVALETVTAPDGASYRAIDCLSCISDELDATSPVTPTAPGSVCMCNGNKISDVSCRCVLAELHGLRPARVCFALPSPAHVSQKANSGKMIGQRSVAELRMLAFFSPDFGRNSRHEVGRQ